MADVLVVAAHPDDEVLGCGASIARWTDAGRSVHIAILGEGITSRSDRREEADRELLDKLHTNARAAGELLGAEGVTLFSLPDNRFDTVPLLDVVKIVERLLAEHKPVDVYTHHAGDLNIDHGVVHRAVLTATRPVAGQCVRNLCTFEVPSSSEWAFGDIAKPFSPNVFVGVGDTLSRKCDAMACYETEARAFPHPRSPQALEAIARRWGSVAGVAAAEAFELVRAVR
ncbi:MAG: PIG-L family deacetylase [Phycisphaerales bacterium]|nr:PIG-L family deacetylase [Phycisphaerales bacterium]